MVEQVDSARQILVPRSVDSRELVDPYGLPALSAQHGVVHDAPMGVLKGLVKKNAVHHVVRRHHHLLFGLYCLLEEVDTSMGICTVLDRCKVLRPAIGHLPVEGRAKLDGSIVVLRRNRNGDTHKMNVSQRHKPTEPQSSSPPLRTLPDYFAC